MLSFLDKIKRSLVTRSMPDAEIIGDIQFSKDGIPYFTVKMRGCASLVDINAEDIIEKFINKFSQADIKNATKAFIKYRSFLRLASIERNFAIFYNKKNASYHLIDLSDNLFLRNFDIDLLKPEDIFKLGMHFEKIRQEKDRKLFSLTKSKNNLTPLRLIHSNE